MRLKASKVNMHLYDAQLGAGSPASLGQGLTTPVKKVAFGQIVDK